MKIYLDSGAKMPTKAHDIDAGYDLYARDNISDTIIYPGLSATFDTGVHISTPISIAGLIVSKSGLNVKHGLVSTGLLDPGYTGSICVKLYNHGSEAYTIRAGDKISQIMFVPIADACLWQVDSLAEFGESARGANGFGSSGR